MTRAGKLMLPMSIRPTRRKSSLKKLLSIFFSSALEMDRPLPSRNSRMENLVLGVRAHADVHAAARVELRQLVAADGDGGGLQVVDVDAHGQQAADEAAVDHAAGGGGVAGDRYRAAQGQGSPIRCAQLHGEFRCDFNVDEAFHAGGAEEAALGLRARNQRAGQGGAGCWIPPCSARPSRSAGCWRARPPRTRWR